MTYREKNFFLAVIEITSSSTWQKDLNTKRNEYASTAFPKYVTVHRRRVGNEVEGCVTAGSLERSRGQIMNKIVKSGMRDIGGRRLRQDKTNKSAEEFTTEWWSVEVRW